MGLFADSKINNKSISIPEKENCFYINSEDNTFSYNGKIFIYKNNRIPSDYINVFADQELFHKDMSSIGKYIINNNIGFKIENTNEYKITYSPLVLCEDNFFAFRNNYAGYIIIENKSTMIYIPYNLYFNEKLYNNLTYTQVYSDEYQISVSDIMNSVVTKEQYSTNFYS